MRVMKTIGLTALCGSMLLFSACGSGSKTVTGSKGDSYQVSDQEKSVSTDEANRKYEPYTITLNLERSGIGHQGNVHFRPETGSFRRRSDDGYFP